MSYHRRPSHKDRESKQINLICRHKKSPKIGRQRNHPQLKEKEEYPKRVLNEIEASNLSGIEFKIMVIRMLKKLRENQKELYGSYKELSRNYTSMRKDIKTMNKSQEEIQNTISELKNTLQGIKSKIDEAEDQTSEMEDKDKKHPVRATKQKRHKKNKNSLREFGDNIKLNNICITEIPEGEKGGRARKSV